MNLSSLPTLHCLRRRLSLFFLTKKGTKKVKDNPIAPRVCPARPLEMFGDIQKLTFNFITWLKPLKYLSTQHSHPVIVVWQELSTFNNKAKS